jgi:hypothetical protein
MLWCHRHSIRDSIPVSITCQTPDSQHQLAIPRSTLRSVQVMYIPATNPASVPIMLMPKVIYRTYSIVCAYMCSTLLGAALLSVFMYFHLSLSLLVSHSTTSFLYAALLFICSYSSALYCHYLPTSTVALVDLIDCFLPITFPVPSLCCTG